MPRAKNAVIAGDYEGRRAVCNGNLLFFDKFLSTPIRLDKNTVKSYNVVDQNAHKDVVSLFTRGLIGNFLLGGVGMAAGVLSAKNNDVFIVVVEFNNGDKSLIEIDRKIYTTMLKVLFY